MYWTRRAPMLGDTNYFFGIIELLRGLILLARSFHEKGNRWLSSNVQGVTNPVIDY